MPIEVMLINTVYIVLITVFPRTFERVCLVENLQNVAWTQIYVLAGSWYLQWPDSAWSCLLLRHCALFDCSCEFQDCNSNIKQVLTVLIKNINVQEVKQC
jgi:hypothetical protein